MLVIKYRQRCFVPNSTPVTQMLNGTAAICQNPQKSILLNYILTLHSLWMTFYVKR